jgi:hypothetical protein
MNLFRISELAVDRLLFSHRTNCVSTLVSSINSSDVYLEVRKRRGHIFFEHKGWYTAAKDMNEKWGTPINVPMSIMYQEPFMII